MIIWIFIKLKINRKFFSLLQNRNNIADIAVILFDGLNGSAARKIFQNGCEKEI